VTWPHSGPATASSALRTSSRRPGPPVRVGAQRQRELERALRTGGQAPLRFRTVGLFTVGGIALAVMTIVLVLVQI